MYRFVSICLTLFALTLGGLTVGCEEDKPSAEKVGKAIDDAAENIKDKAEDAVDDAKDAVDDALN